MSRILIISIYDMGCSFKAIILKDNKIEKTIRHQYELKEFGLYNQEYCLFDGDLITTDNEKIKQFDKIIVCVDGEIEIYINGKFVMEDDKDE